MRCELALQISRQLHLQRTYFFPAGAGRIAYNKQQKIGKCQYVNIHHFCTRYGFLTTAWNAAILWHIILLLRSELHSGICRWRKWAPYKAAGWAGWAWSTHAASVLSAPGSMQAGLPAVASQRGRAICVDTAGNSGISPYTGLWAKPLVTIQNIMHCKPGQHSDVITTFTLAIPSGITKFHSVFEMGNQKLNYLCFCTINHFFQFVVTPTGLLEWNYCRLGGDEGCPKSQSSEFMKHVFTCHVSFLHHKQQYKKLDFCTTNIQTTFQSSEFPQSQKAWVRRAFFHSSSFENGHIWHITKLNVCFNMTKPRYEILLQQF